MSEMYDPNNPAHVGPQVTARPGTKRHLRQVRARAVFFAIHAVTANNEPRQQVRGSWQCKWCGDWNENPVARSCEHCQLVREPQVNDSAKRAEAAYEAAKARTAKAEAELAAVEMLLLIIAEPQGSA